MNIFQEDCKVGYVHRRFSKTDTGYKVCESVFMQISAMGMVQDIRFKTEGNLKPDLTLASFDFELLSGLFSFTARGVVNGKTLTLFTGTPGSERKFDILLKKAPHLGVGIVETVWGSGLKEGQERTFHVFDPVTMAERPVKVEVLGDETITIMGAKVRTKKVSIDFMGAEQFAWIGEDGRILKEEGILGIRLERVTRDEALHGLSVASGADFAEIASIPSNVIIDNPDRLTEFKVTIGGIEDAEILLDGGRQAFRDSVLTVRKETIPGYGLKALPDSVKIFLKPTPFIQSDHPKIQATVKKIISPDDPVIVKARKLTAWVHKHIQKRPVISIPSALDTLNNMVGDCNEHAVLLAALARAAGIPAQIETGIVYQEGRFYYHAWNVLYLGEWITADSVRGQLPVDVTHIRFIRGTTEQQVDLMRVIGKIKLEILEQIK